MVFLPCEEGIESADAGMHSPLLWLTIEAAVYCGIMKPLLRPGLPRGTRAAARTGDELVGAAFGDVAQLGYRDGEEIHRHGYRLAVEVAGPR